MRLAFSLAYTIAAAKKEDKENQQRTYIIHFNGAPCIFTLQRTAQIWNVLCTLYNCDIQRNI